jgi:hypothetical protein
MGSWRWMNRDKEINRIRQRIEDLRSIQASSHEIYDKLPVRNYYTPKEDEEAMKVQV